MIIFPAIDMHNGRCVRLLQGRIEDETIYSEDPVVVSQEWQHQGASWLHLVDLDGAMSANKNNRLLARQIFKTLSIPVQIGGGIRSISDVQELLDAGAARVIVGTTAVQQPKILEELLKNFSNKIVVGLDARDGLVVTQGWQQVESIKAISFAQELCRLGVERVIYTDTSKDGMLKGPNLTGIRTLAENAKIKVIASGGISSLEDLLQLKTIESLGIEGVVIGKALYEKRFSLAKALRCVEG